MLRIVFLMLGLFFGCLLPTAGQTPAYRADKWEISLFAGFDSSGDKDSATPVQGQQQPRLVSVDYASGYVAGIRISENLGDRIAADLDYTFANQPMAFVNLTPAIPRLDLDHSTHTFIYSLVVYPMSLGSRFKPFADFGAGAVLFHVSGDSKARAKVQGVSVKDQWKLAGSFGGGLKFRVTQRVAFRGEFRDVVTGAPGHGLPRTALVIGGQIQPAYQPSGMIHNLQFSAGVVFAWGGF